MLKYPSEKITELKKHTDTPICVGFGISNPETVIEACKVADGASVGSAFIHHINDAVKANASRDEIVENVGKLLSELIKPVL